QGVGAAALLPATLALVPHLFTARADRERATVTWVAAGSIAVAAGPLIGGLLIDAFGWRSIFLINLPVGLVSAWLARAHVPETPRHRVPLDHGGQGAAAAALGLLTAGLITGGAAGWAAPATLGLLAGGIAAGFGFWLAERHGRHPMLPLSFLRHRVRTAAVACAGLMGFVFYGTLFVMSLYFQQVRGLSPGAAGIALLPLTISSTVGPLILYRPLSRRYGHPAMLAAGFACCGAGTAVLAAVGAGWPAADRRREHDRVLRAHLAVDGRHPGRPGRAGLRPAEHHAPGRRPHRGVRPRLVAEHQSDRGAPAGRVPHHPPRRRRRDHPRRGGQESQGRKRSKPRSFWMNWLPRPDHPVLGHDRGDQVGGGDVEVIVERAGALGRGPHALEGGDLLIRPELKRDVGPAGRRLVDR